MPNPAFETIDFKEVSCCPYCGAETEELTTSRSEHDWEGATYCSDGCGCLEGAETETKYECVTCHELRDTPECSCGEHEFNPED